MTYTSIIVRAFWDDEASVWVASSNDIDGLALEAETLEVLAKKIPEALCDLLEVNGYPQGNEMPDIPFHLMAEQTGRIPNPCV